jgi:signal transduction histidine kinase
LLHKKIAPSDPSHGMAGIIVEEAERLNRIISDFLAYARPIQPDLLPIQVIDVLDKTILFLAPQLEEAGVRVTRHAAPGLPVIRGDAALLHQSFLNLLLNAMQAMPSGGTIDVKLHTQSERLVIQIIDHGSGVAAELREKIWTPFFTTKEQGTGLGLAIVRNIIETHGGSIAISNQEGAGACFSLALPIDRETQRHGNGSDRR